MREFHIPKIPATTNKSIRFPNDVIEGVEEAIRGTDCSFSAFVIEATRVALANLAEGKGRLTAPPVLRYDSYARGSCLRRVSFSSPKRRTL